MAPTLTSPAATALIYLFASVLLVGGIGMGISWMVNMLAEAFEIGES